MVFPDSQDALIRKAVSFAKARWAEMRKLIEAHRVDPRSQVSVRGEVELDQIIWRDLIEKLKTIPNEEAQQACKQVLEIAVEAAKEVCIMDREIAEEAAKEAREADQEVIESDEEHAERLERAIKEMDFLMGESYPLQQPEVNRVERTETVTETQEEVVESYIMQQPKVNSVERTETIVETVEVVESAARQAKHHAKGKANQQSIGDELSGAGEMEQEPLSTVIMAEEPLGTVAGAEVVKQAEEPLIIMAEEPSRTIAGAEVIKKAEELYQPIVRATEAGIPNLLDTRRGKERECGHASARALPPYEDRQRSWVDHDQRLQPDGFCGPKAKPDHGDHQVMKTCDKPTLKSEQPGREREKEDCLF